MLPYFTEIFEQNIFTKTHVFIPQVYVLKRPHVDEFLRKIGEMFECILFTASLAKVTHSAFLNR